MSINNVLYRVQKVYIHLCIKKQYFNLQIANLYTNKLLTYSGVISCNVHLKVKIYFYTEVI